MTDSLCVSACVSVVATHMFRCFLLYHQMVSLWVSQGEAVQGGAVAPMMLGAMAVASYALLFGEFHIKFRNLDTSDNTFGTASPHTAEDPSLWPETDGGVLAASIALAWFLSAICVSIPVFFVLRALTAHRERMAALFASTNGLEDPNTNTTATTNAASDASASTNGTDLSHVELADSRTKSNGTNGITNGNGHTHVSVELTERETESPEPVMAVAPSPDQAVDARSDARAPFSHSS